MSEEKLLTITAEFIENVSDEKIEKLASALMRLVEDEKLVKALDTLEALVDAISLLSVMHDDELQNRIENFVEAVTPCALNVDRRVGLVTEALAKALNESLEYSPAGIGDILRALRDPDVQKAIGFILKFLKEFGKRI